MFLSRYVATLWASPTPQMIFNVGSDQEMNSHIHLAIVNVKNLSYFEISKYLPNPGSSTCILVCTSTKLSLISSVLNISHITGSEKDDPQNDCTAIEIP